MIDEDHTVYVICLHFAKAFDYVNHRFLLAKMKYFGLVDVVVRWIEAYLTDRVLRVHVDGELSRTISMCTSVLRCSVMGPLLLPIFVNDLPDTLEALTLFSADDVKMVTHRTQNMSLHSSSIAAWDWPKKWYLRINPAKCKYFTIGQEVTLKFTFLPDGSGTPVPVSKLPKSSHCLHDISNKWLKIRSNSKPNLALHISEHERHSVEN